MNLEDLMECKRHLSMAHHVPGRIRVKFTSGLLRHPLVRAMAADPARRSALARQAGLGPVFGDNGTARDPSAIPGVNGIRLNWKGRSVIIEYDPAFWKPEWLDELLNTGDTRRVQAILETMARKMEVNDE
jgi:hypothetical protein